MFYSIRRFSCLLHLFSLSCNKKSSCPCSIQGQKLITSAVPPKLAYDTPTPFAYHHMHPTDNGQGSRQRLLIQDFSLPSIQFPDSVSRILISDFCELSFRAALTSPFRKIYATAFSPSAVLWIHPIFLTSLAQRFCFLPLYSKKLFLSMIFLFFLRIFKTTYLQ